LDSRKLLDLLRYAKKFCPLVIRGEEMLLAKTAAQAEKTFPHLESADFIF
jgi:hypothetical protein